MYLFVPTFLPSLASFLHVPFTTAALSLLSWATIEGFVKGGTFLVREKRGSWLSIGESSRMIDSWSENDTKGLLMGLMSRHPASGCLSRPLEITGRKKKGRGEGGWRHFHSSRGDLGEIGLSCRCSITLEGVRKLDFSSWLFYARLKLLTCLFDWMWIRYFELLRF